MGFVAAAPLAAQVAFGLTAAATAVSAYSTYQAGRAQTQAARYNAQLAEQQAADARRRGEFAEDQVRKRYAALIGRQRSLYASAGVEVGTGTPALVIENTAALGELDSLMARVNAEREAWGYDQLVTQFGFDEQAGRLRQTVGTASELVGGATRAVGLTLPYGR